jgi:hypothetical protein
MKADGRDAGEDSINGRECLDAGAGTPKTIRIRGKRAAKEGAMEYFDVPEANPGADGICSDNDCPCGFPGARIPRGSGYIYVSSECVDFRRDARSMAEAELKMNLIRQRMGGLVMFDPTLITSILMCEQGARKRGLDLGVAAADARHWWLTHKVPLRATPAGGGSAAAEPPQPAVFIRKIEAEGATLEEAGQKLRSLLGPGEKIVSEETVSNGSPRSSRSKGDTAKAAFGQARQKIPKGSRISEERELSAPGEEAFALEVEAFDEEEAKERAKAMGKERKHRGRVHFQSLKLLSQGKKGFLGMGKKPNRYEASMADRWQAEVEIVFVPPIKVSARVKQE